MQTACKLNRKLVRSDDAMKDSEEAFTVAITRENEAVPVHRQYKISMLKTSPTSAICVVPNCYD